MWKTKNPIPFGDDTLSLIVPVRFEGDLRTGMLHIYPGFAIHTSAGLVLGTIEDTPGEGQQHLSLPGPEVQLTISHDPADPLLVEAREAMERALDKYMLWALQKMHANGEERTFRVGRTVYPLALEWAERDPKKHGSCMEHTLMEKKKENS